MLLRLLTQSLAIVGALLLTLVSSPARIFAQFTDKITTTPAVVQDGFGPAGNLLPYGGQEYCVPTSTTMSLLYLGVNGFNQIAPANPTSADALNLVRVMGGLMGTTPTGGTQYDAMSGAVSTYLAAKGISNANYSISVVNSPTLQQLSALNQNQTVVDLCGGYYNDSTGNRGGGHCIALLSQGINSFGQPSPNTLVVNDPLPGALAPSPDLSSHSLQYLNTVATTGPLTGDGSIMLDPNQYPGFWGDTRYVVQSAFALTVDPSQISSNHPAVSTWTLTSTQTINLQSGYLSVLAPLAGSGGITKGDVGTLEMTAANESTGANVLGAGLWQSDVAAGRPFGSGSMQIVSGTLQLMPASGNGDVSLVMADGGGNLVTYSGGGQIGLNRNGNNSLTFTLGGNDDGSTPNLSRSNNGTLVIAAASGIENLGGAGLANSERLFVAGTGGNLPALINGIVSTSIVGQNNDANASGDFLTYGINGFARASYTLASSTNISAANSQTVFEADVALTVGSGMTAAVYALKVDAVSITGGGGATTINVGSQTSGSQAGVILNGGTISTTNLNFGPAEATIYTSNAGGTINAVIQGSGGLTSFGPGPLTLAAANVYSGATNINSGTLIAANSTGSATGDSSSITIQNGATLQINAGALVGKTSASTTTINPGGTLFLNGGTLAGALEISDPTATLAGQGTLSNKVAITGCTIAAPAAGVDNITFASKSVSIVNAIYSWQLNSLDAAPADKGINWSLLSFTSASGAKFGTSLNSPVYYTLNLGSGVPDPNSGNAFWNQPHTWLVAQDAAGFSSAYYSPAFPTYAQGNFSVAINSQFTEIYINFTPTPEPALILLWAGAMLAAGRFLFRPRAAKV